MSRFASWWSPRRWLTCCRVVWSPDAWKRSISTRLLYQAFRIIAWSPSAWASKASQINILATLPDSRGQPILQATLAQSSPKAMPRTSSTKSIRNYLSSLSMPLCPIGGNIGMSGLRRRSMQRQEIAGAIKRAKSSAQRDELGVKWSCPSQYAKYKLITSSNHMMVHLQSRGAGCISLLSPAPCCPPVISARNASWARCLCSSSHRGGFRVRIWTLPFWVTNLARALFSRIKYRFMITFGKWFNDTTCSHTWKNIWCMLQCQAVTGALELQPSSCFPKTASVTSDTSTESWVLAVELFEHKVLMIFSYLTSNV